MKQPYVSIVIPAFNAASTVGQAIDSCKNQDYPKDRLEIIVVNDGSRDNTKDVVEGFGVRYIYQENKGPAFARNNGWKNSKGEAIFFTDADCIPGKDCLAVMVKSLYDRNAGAVAGTYEIKNVEDIMARCIHAEIMFRHSRMPDYINSFGTYNVLIKKSILEEFSGFNEGYLTSSAEDSELSYRMVKKGYRIYFERKSIVSHFHEKKMRRYLKKQFTRSFWAIRLWRHHPGFALNDCYLHWKDLVEAPLAAIVILTMPFLFIGSFKIFFFILLFIYIGVETIIPFSIYCKRFYKKDFFFMVFMMFVRGFVRMAGGTLSLMAEIRHRK
ncbi:MAG: hypothetical protein AUJ70_04670 [Candidatus Omnitrophica bacterium CG1_02_40_15]|nr:MAG: hypothetical protein AUJ70_04670 [Candidatus Omnitrophica bacterium CG1_02_40_15]